MTLTMSAGCKPDAPLEQSLRKQTAASFQLQHQTGQLQLLFMLKTLLLDNRPFIHEDDINFDLILWKHDISHIINYQLALLHLKCCQCRGRNGGLKRLLLRGGMMRKVALVASLNAHKHEPSHWSHLRQAHLLDFLLHHRHRSDMRLKERSDMTVRTAAIRPGLALISGDTAGGGETAARPRSARWSSGGEAVAQAAAVDRKWSPEAQPKRALDAVTFERSCRLAL